MSPRILALLLSAGLLATHATARAQTPESDLPDQIDPASLRQDFAISDANANKLLVDVQDDEGFFTWKPGLVLLYDWNAIDQDDAAIAAVGEPGQESEWRSIRFTNRGRIGHSGRLSYLVSFEYKGFNNGPDDRDWSWTDIALKYDVGTAGTLTVGKQKMTSIYEMVGDSANLPHQERVLSPFFQSRTVGVTWLNPWENGRGTFAAGLYNDAWAQPGDVDLDQRGMQFTARITGLAWWEDDGNRFLHLGASARHLEDDNPDLRLKGKPASNVLPNYADTGNFEADYARFFGLEALWNHGPVSVLGEWVAGAADAPVLGDPQFSGWYLTGAWVVTGETRPYDRKVGYARRVLPQGHWGAVELVGRLGSVDLNDGDVQGGQFRIQTLGVNWWATQRIKFGVHWTRTRLELSGPDSDTDAVQTRAQWIF